MSVQLLYLYPPTFCFPAAPSFPTGLSPATLQDELTHLQTAQGGAAQKGQFCVVGIQPHIEHACFFLYVEQLIELSITELCQTPSCVFAAQIC